MGIFIQNIDPNPRPSGEHLYRLSINNKEVCTFIHRREEELSECLYRAAEAAGRTMAEQSNAYLKTVKFLREAFTK